MVPNVSRDVWDDCLGLEKVLDLVEDRIETV